MHYRNVNLFESRKATSRWCPKRVRVIIISVWVYTTARVLILSPTLFIGNYIFNAVAPVSRIGDSRWGIDFIKRVAIARKIGHRGNRRRALSLFTQGCAGNYINDICTRTLSASRISDRTRATGFPPSLTTRRIFSPKGLLRTRRRKRIYPAHSHYYVTGKHLLLIIFPCLRAGFRAFHPHDVIERDSNKSHAAVVRSFPSSPFGRTIEVSD